MPVQDRFNQQIPTSEEQANELISQVEAAKNRIFPKPGKQLQFNSKPDFISNGLILQHKTIFNIVQHRYMAKWSHRISA